MNKMSSKLSKNQNGIASIVVTIIMCLVITLIVVGFGGIARREQRQALDQQLSVQAFYAAESAINQKISALKNNPDSVTNTTDCGSAAATFAVPASDQIVTTCVQVTKNLSSLVYSLNPGDTMLIPVNTTNDLGTLHFQWSSEDDETIDSCSADPSVLPSNTYPATQLGMVRVDITRGDGGGTNNFGRSALAAQNFSMLLSPYQRPDPIGAYYDANTTPDHPTYGAAFPNFQTNDYFATLNSSVSHGFGQPSGRGVGYTTAEYNKFVNVLGLAAPQNQKSNYSAPNYGPTSGSNVASVNWLPFWNWLEDYRAYKGDPNARPVAYTTSGFPSRHFGNYRIASTNSETDNRRAYFQEWARSILGSGPTPAGTIQYFPFNDPATKTTATVSGPRVTFAPNDTNNNPTFVGDCVPGTAAAGSKAIGNANVVFPSPHIKGPYYLRVRNMYTKSRLVITPYKPDGTADTTTPFTTSSSGSGGQVVVEATARVRDIVRRIQVRMTLGGGSGTTGFPDQAIRTTSDLCKLLKTSPTSTIDDCVYD